MEPLEKRGDVERTRIERRLAAADRDKDAVGGKIGKPVPGLPILILLAVILMVVLVWAGA